MTKFFDSFSSMFVRTQLCLLSLALGFHAVNDVLDLVLQQFYSSSSSHSSSMLKVPNGVLKTFVYISKAGFHMIPDDRGSQIADRRRSQRELFPYDRRRSQTIAEPTVAIHCVQRKCQMYTRVVLAGKSQQTTWRTSRRKFCCKQIYFSF